jgi:2-oxoglutarate ferredoxin oxidoreductase subunit gamma
MVGFLTAATKIASREEMREAVKAAVPPGTEELNLNAFDAGWAFFEEEYGRKKEKEATVTAEPTA